MPLLDSDSWDMTGNKGLVLDVAFTCICFGQ